MQVSGTVRMKLIEALYGEALQLSDDVRATFNLAEIEARGGPADDPYKVALSCEALRATTRMMHAVAWLLNHRAFLRGELSEFQLRRAGDLSKMTPPDNQRVARLGEKMQALIVRTEEFYARLHRIEAEWKAGGAEPATPVADLQKQLAQRLKETG